MVPWRASHDGEMTPELLDWYGRFAAGKPGVLVVEATGIRNVPSGPLLRIHEDRYVEGLKRLVDVVKTRSQGQTRLFIQLIDFLRVRRRPDRERFLSEFLTITARHRSFLGGPGSTDSVVRTWLKGLEPDVLQQILTEREWESLTKGARERVTDTHLPAIAALPKTLPGCFSAAAQRAKEAGFDGVELHFAHAYTMSSFLSGLNTRRDGYGGPRENRIRLPLEVYEAVRERVGSQFTVGARFLVDEVIDGGYGVEDAAWFGQVLAGAGMDFLSLSTGGKFEDAAQPAVGRAVYPYTGPSGYECMPTVRSDKKGPFGRNIAKQSQVRQSVRDAGLDTPVVVAGGICSFQQAEEILSAGEGDLVASARQSLADPDWFEKMRRGLGAAVRRCKYTNYCEALDQRHRQVTCQLWDRTGLDEVDLRRSNDGKRRLVAPAWDGGALSLKDAP
jgi:2,4-dienoyl-CoA reductase-like NADH-dependent reductase (Old Yellow Enzyme family)